MPYKSTKELPDTLKAIPEPAKEIYLAAYNSAAEGTCKDAGAKMESCASAIAWSSVGKKFEKVEDKWVEKKEETSSIIHSITTEKPRVDNGTWLAFMKPNQLAEDASGKRYRITKEAIENGYKSFLGGFINVNHSDKIKGKIEAVKYDGNFAYAKLSGLDNEAVDVINSAAYRGVSQQSFNLKAIPGEDDMTDVLELKGEGLAVALYPRTPGCDLKMGCGLPIASVLTEDKKPEYTVDQMKSVLAYMNGHQDMLDDSMKKMMAGMMGGKTTSTVTAPKINVKFNLTTGAWQKS